jgi:hypothetical protein
MPGLMVGFYLEVGLNGNVTSVLQKCIYLLKHPSKNLEENELQKPSPNLL